jgi:catechol 2,3-dioxygenase-like lactoylglutathione lyase family enzyme
MAIFGFDHFIILTNNLDAATQRYRRLGFEVRAGGEHPAMGSHNALIAIADRTYIELVGFKDTALAVKSYWRAGVECLQSGEGFGGYVLASNDLASDVAQIKQRALVYDEPKPGSRVRPDGQRVEWQTAMFNGSPIGLLPFLIQDVTPHTLRIEPPTDGIGSRGRVKEAVIAVRDVKQAGQAYHLLLNKKPERVPDAPDEAQSYRFAMDWGVIILMHPQKSGNAPADQLAWGREGICALTLEVDGVERDSIRFKNEGIPFDMDSNGLSIDPAFACGAQLRLVQNRKQAGI